MSFGQGNSVRSNPLSRIATQGDKPKREVFPTSEIPHKWAHQTQSRARNAQGNLFFNGPTIYSYRESWPLARIYTKRVRNAGHDEGSAKVHGEEKLVLSNCQKYSNTTAGQQHDVNRAVSHLHRIAVPNVEAQYGTALSKKEHADNLRHLAVLAEFNLLKATRAMASSSVAVMRAIAFRAIQDSERYMEFFSIRRKAPAFPELAWNAAAARAERIENPDPASIDKRERASAERKRRNAERDAYLAEQRRSIYAAKHARDFYRVGAARSSFRLGDAWGEDYEGLRSSACMLRIAGEEIETSWGARVPLAAAPMVWNLVERARQAGGYESTGFGKALRSAGRIKIGDYPLDRIDADGTLHAGCHTIPHSELRGMARALELA